MRTDSGRPRRELAALFDRSGFAFSRLSDFSRLISRTCRAFLLLKQVSDDAQFGAQTFVNFKAVHQPEKLVSSNHPLRLVVREFQPRHSTCKCDKLYGSGTRGAMEFPRLPCADNHLYPVCGKGYSGRTAYAS